LATTSNAELGDFRVFLFLKRCSHRSMR